MFCSNCGTKVGDEMKFCPHCGARLSPMAEKTAGRPAEQASAAAQATSPGTVQQAVPPIKRGAGSATAWLLVLFSYPLAILLNLANMSAEVQAIVQLLALFVFLALDVSKLRAAGIETSRWSWTGVVLLPAYLFIRARKTNRRYGCAITACILLVLALAALSYGWEQGYFA